ncbi:MAG: glycerol-3-phosphate 1-O-acyltransferase PlsY [Bacteroidetes bacterium]|jgi:glycerol-3-phosphate acyltransferase PlsY|nr:glycerol-3-phosphate 1-O-acyltransferase PlsY [Bacteroidota bacterium]
MILVAVIAIVAAYLIGSLSGGLILGRFFGQGDLRTSGSGNAGATNALRAGGRGYGLSVLLFDLIKGTVAGGLVPWLVAAAPPLAFTCGAVAVIGHVWPVFFGFRGGKGAATGVGVLLVLLPGALIMGAAVWIAVLVASGFVGLATMLGMVGVALACLFAPAATGAAKVFVVFITVLIVYTHRGNIARMRAGTENRFSRIMFWRRDS